MRTFVCVMIALSLLAGEAKARIWTTATGKAKVEADFLGMENGIVKLELSRTGKVVLLPLNAFSEADQRYVKEQPAPIKTPWRTAEPLLASLEKRLLKAGTAAPRDPQPHVLRGILLMQMRELDEAIREFGEALRVAPNSPHAFHGRALTRQKKDDLAAWKDFDRVVSLAPQWSAAYRNRGEYCYKLALCRKIDQESGKMIDAARPRLEELREREMEQRPWRPLDGFTWRKASPPLVFLKLAKMDFERAKQITNSDDDLEQACSLLEKASVDEAVVLLSEAISRDTISSPAYRKRADAHLQLGELEKAITDLSMAIQIDPRDADTLRDLSRAYDELDRTRDN